MARQGRGESEAVPNPGAGPRAGRTAHRRACVPVVAVTRRRPPEGRARRQGSGSCPPRGASSSRCARRADRERQELRPRGHRAARHRRGGVGCVLGEVQARSYRGAPTRPPQQRATHLTQHHVATSSIRRGSSSNERNRHQSAAADPRHVGAAWRTADPEAAGRALRSAASVCSTWSDGSARGLARVCHVTGLRDQHADRGSGRARALGPRLGPLRCPWARAGPVEQRRTSPARPPARRIPTIAAPRREGDDPSRPGAP